MTLRAALLLLGGILLWTGPAGADPVGGQVVAGSARIDQSLPGQTVIVQNSATVAIDWQQFNVSAGESVEFRQPDSSAAALNRIHDGLPSEIYGRIDANGQVFLLNPNGLLFGPDSQVNVGALVAGAFSVDPVAFMVGERVFAAGAGSVINQGSIHAAPGGSVVLLGAKVTNDGLIDAPNGSVTLAAGRGAALTPVALDASGLFAVQLDASLTPSVVTNHGTIQATGISREGGVVRLVGSEVIHTGHIDVSGTDGGSALIGGNRHGAPLAGQTAGTTRIGVDATIRADASGTGNGGEVVVWADGHTDYAGTISARGGDNGGNGGFVEVSGARTLNFTGHVDTRAPQGATGTLLLDPATLTIVDLASGGAQDGGLIAPNPQLLAGTDPGLAYTLSWGKIDALSAANSVLLEATGDITVADITGAAGGATSVLDTVTLDFAFGTGLTLTSTGGNIVFADLNDTIQTAGGSVTLNAAGNITAGHIDTSLFAGGAVTLSAGGDLSVQSVRTNFGMVNLIADSNGNGIHTLTLGGAVTALNGGSISLTGGADLNDTLAATNGTNSWAVSTANTGTLNGIGFSNFANLTGGSGDDSFAVANGANFSGVINGGGQGVAGDGVDYSAITGPHTVTLDNRLLNIERLLGNGTLHTLQSSGAAATWNITGANSGSLAGVAFSGFTDLLGGVGDDQFVLGAAGSISGTIDGGIHLTGDSLDYSTITTPLTVTVGTGAVNVEQLVGNGSNHTLALPGGNFTWTVSGSNSGNVAGTGFSGFSSLSGGTGNDTFVLAAGGNLSGSIDGGLGSDTLSVTNQTTLWDITGADSGSLTGVGAYSSVENLLGGSADDRFAFTAAGSVSGVLDGGAHVTGDVYDTTAIAGAHTVLLGATRLNLEQALGNSTHTLALEGGNLWNINAANAGQVAGIGFTGFGNLAGGSGDDQFSFTATGSLSGNIDGGGQISADHVDYSALAGPQNVILGTDVSAIEAVTGGGAGFTLTGTAGTDNWTLNGADAGRVDGTTYSGFANLNGAAGNDRFTMTTGTVSGTVDGGTGSDTLIGPDAGVSWVLSGVDSGSGPLAFSAMENLTGGTGDDQFTLAGGSLTGSLDGGLGNDSLQGDNLTNVWTINAANGGLVTGVGAYSGVENLLGGSADDRFAFTAAGSVSGTIDGGAHLNADVLDYAAITTPLTVSVGDATAPTQNVETISGNSANHTLSVTGGNPVWHINGAGSGTVAGIGFSGFTNLSGASGDDQFIFAAGGSITGLIDAGAHSIGDLADYSAVSGPLLVSLETGLNNVEQVVGSATHSLVGANQNNAWSLSGVDAGTVSGTAYSGFGSLIGGTAADTFSFVGGSVSGSLDGGAGSDTVVGTDAATAWLVSGPGTGSFTNGPGFSAIENLQGGAGNDSFLLAGGSVSGSINGAAGNDTLLADNTPNSWSITALGGGSVTGLGGFSGVENLIGGNADDRFVFSASGAVSGTLDGGSQTTVDSANYAALAAPQTVRLGVDVLNIESVSGDPVSDALAGPSGANTWTFTGLNSGTLTSSSIGSVAFDGFSQYLGGSGNETFVLANGSVTGLLSGGAGTDTLVADNRVNSWFINGPGTGTVTGAAAFTGMENLTGGSVADRFSLSNGATAGVAGSISGGAGDDTLIVDYQGVGSRTIVFDGGSGIDRVTLTGVADRGSYTPDGSGVVMTHEVGINAQTVQGTGVNAWLDNVISQSVSVFGTPVADTISLTGSGAPGSFPLQVVVSGFPTLTVTESPSLTINGGIGVDQINLVGDLTLPGNIDLIAEAITDSVGALLTTPELTLHGTAVIGNAAQPLRMNVTTLNLLQTGGDAFLTNAGATTLAAADLGGSLNLTSGGDFSAGALTVAGNTTLTVADGASIDLSDPGNRFDGTLTLGSLGTLANLNLLDTGAVTLGAITLSGDLQVSATAIDQSAPLNVTGVTTLAASSVVLDDAANQFTGAVHSSGGTLTLAATGPITLGAVDATALNVSATDISQSAALIQSGGPVVLDAGSGTIALTQVGNTIGGEMTLTADGDIAVTTAQTMSVTHATTGAALVLNAGGDIRLGEVQADSVSVGSSNGDLIVHNNTVQITANSLDVVVPGRLAGSFIVPLNLSVTGSVAFDAAEVHYRGQVGDVSIANAGHLVNTDRVIAAAGVGRQVVPRELPVVDPFAWRLSDDILQIIHDGLRIPDKAIY